MDALTAFVIAALMILLNGGVLGLMHRDLPEAMHGSAFSWRVGTLLQAGGCILLAVQQTLPTPYMLPLAHGMLMLGITAYWHALRLFYGRRSALWLLLPPVLGTLGIFWFAAIHAEVVGRLLVLAVVWGTIMLGCIATLLAAPAGDTALSRRVLTGIFVSVALIVVGTIAIVLALPEPVAVVAQRAGWINLIAPTIAAVLPVTGTTAYLQLCSERIRRQWEQAASRDHLTGLPNRRTVATAGERRLRQALQRGRSLAVALIDIDRFKTINDRFGHEIGDQALCHVAGSIEAACRDKDLLARHGGEEFVAVFEGVDEAKALVLGERIREAVESAPFDAAGEPVRITVSLGIALLAEGDRTLDDLLRRADRALYAAKAGGRNRVELAAAG